MFVIYYALNKTNGKAYIGKTSNFKSRLRQHRHDMKKSQKHFHKALRKYGFDGFEFRIIDTASTKDRASEFEKFYINLFDTYKRDRGYNLTMGGEGCPATEETKKKLSDTMIRIGHKPSLEDSKKGVESLKLLLTGKPRPDWVRKKISEAKKGKCSDKLRAALNENRKKLNRDDIPNDAIVKLYDSGLSTRKIAEMFNTNQATISWRLRKMRSGGAIFRTPKSVV